MSTSSQFSPGAIKSIQRGIINQNQATVAVTISAVNMAKSELRFLGTYSEISTGYPSLEMGVTLQLTNATTITSTKYAYGTYGGKVAWELTERY